MRDLPVRVGHERLDVVGSRQEADLAASVLDDEATWQEDAGRRVFLVDQPLRRQVNGMGHDSGDVGTDAAVKVSVEAGGDDRLDHIDIAIA